jgi:hypothetical protein
VLRLTALIFVTKLLYNVPEIVDTLLLRDNCDPMAKRGTGSSTQGQKYIITGLRGYGIEGQQMLELITLINTKVKYKKNVLFWHLNLTTKRIGYFTLSDHLEDTDIDPQTHLIGIFVGESTGKEAREVKGVKEGKGNVPTTPTAHIRRNTGEQGKSKVGVVKQGYFSSVNRKF